MWSASKDQFHVSRDECCCVDKRMTTLRRSAGFRVLSRMDHLNFQTFRTPHLAAGSLTVDGYFPSDSIRSLLAIATYI